jgi:ketosteroid isomerase-like protein
MSQRSIEDFKAVLQGGGVRPTMFEVELTFPDAIAPDLGEVTRDGTFLIKAAGLPASNIGQIAVPFRGRKLKVAGDRSFEDWQVTIINDVSFGLRTAMEKWSEKIQNHNYALGAIELQQYYASAIVRQLDRDGSQLRAYSFEGIWPQVVGGISLDFEATDTIEQYDVNFAVQYWSASASGDPAASSVPRDFTGRSLDIIS